MKKPNKLIEFEILRAVCIVFLMCVHSDIFSRVVWGIKLEPIGPYMGAFMLGCFFFMGGYFTEYSHRNRQQNFFAYLWSKFIRLFPPYWLALLLYVTVMGFTLKRFDFLMYFLDLQFILSPAFIKPLLTLWYLSVIFAYYVGFGLFLPRRTRDLIIWSVLIFGVCYFLSLQYRLFDDRFFEYYFVFLAGILIARYDELRERIFNAAWFVQLTVAVVAAVLFGFFEFGDYRVRSAGYLFASNLYILSWAVLALRLFRQDWIHWRIWGPLSYGSFFAYLFHRPIWEIMFWYLKFPWDIYAGWYRLLPGSIFVFVICFYLQAVYDLLLRMGTNLWGRLVSKLAAAER